MQITAWRKNVSMVTVTQKGATISQGSVVTCLRCGGIFKDYFITNLLRSLLPKYKIRSAFGAATGNNVVAMTVKLMH